VPVQDYDIRPLDVRAASDHEYACINAFENILRAEVLPDDPPIPCDEDTARLKAMPDFIRHSAWAVWDHLGASILASAWAEADRSGDNPHVCDFIVQVLPEIRRQGLGRELLRRVVAFARNHERRLLFGYSNERVPAGGEFLARIGARKGLEAGENQLCLADLDRTLVARWMDQAAKLSDEFSLGLWDGPVPESRLAGMIALVQQLINDAPHDALDIQDSTHISDTYRPFETWEIAGGRRRWLMYAIQRAEDRVVGMTDVTWSPSRPAIIEQGGTGVWPSCRNRGLGRWLKAAMLTRILGELPEARVIRTGNANSNAAMLKINWELGFKPFISRPIWQVETETVEKYLAGSLQAA
jgi:mycothiol synthase